MKKVILLGLGMLISFSFAYAGKFEGTFVLKTEMTSASPRKEAPQEMNVTIKGDNALMIPVTANDKGPKTKFLLNFSDRSSTILFDNNNNKRGLKRPANEMGIKANPHDDSKVTETKEEKVIEGYKCHKVIIESPSMLTEAWFTNDVDVALSEISLVLTSLRGPAGDPASLGSKTIKGCPLEVTSTDKRTKTAHLFSIKNIKKSTVDAKLFSTDGYTISEMPGPGARPDMRGRPGAPGARPGDPNMPPSPPTLNGQPMPGEMQPHPPVPTPPTR